MRMVLTFRMLHLALWAQIFKDVTGAFHKWNGQLLLFCTLGCLLSLNSCLLQEGRLKDQIRNDNCTLLEV